MADSLPLPLAPTAHTPVPLPVLALVVLLLGAIITLLPLPSTPSAPRSTLFAQKHGKTPLERVRASQRARERVPIRRGGKVIRPGREEEEDVTSLRNDTEPSEAGRRRPAPPTPTPTTSQSTTQSQPQPQSTNSQQQQDIRRKPRRRPRAHLANSSTSTSTSTSTSSSISDAPTPSPLSNPSSSSSSSTPTSALTPTPAPPATRVTQTFSLELDPELLDLLAARNRRQRANSLPSSARRKQPQQPQHPQQQQQQQGVSIAATATATQRVVPGAPGWREHYSSKRTSSLDPSAPEFTPTSNSSTSYTAYPGYAHPGQAYGYPYPYPPSLSLSLSLSLSPLSLSPTVSGSTLSLSPPDSPAVELHRPFVFPFPAAPHVDPVRAGSPGPAAVAGVSPGGGTAGEMRGEGEAGTVMGMGMGTGKVFRRQPFDAFLVLDVEATCVEGGGFDWPNEIIEWPVILLKWSEMDTSGRLSTLVPTASFRTFIRPTWSPHLSPFCTSLTGITQSSIDSAPSFPQAMAAFEQWLEEQGLWDAEAGEKRGAWSFATDGPWDLRDFLVKQCWLSGVPIPAWAGGAVIDVRKVLRRELGCSVGRPSSPSSDGREREREREKEKDKHSPGLLSIPCQLRKLGLAPFEGRQHSGMDDTRNIARILQELGRRGVVLEQNTPLPVFLPSTSLDDAGLGGVGGGAVGTRYGWMGERVGEVVRGERWKDWARDAPDLHTEAPAQDTPCEEKDATVLAEPNRLLDVRLAPIPESAPFTPVIEFQPNVLPVAVGAA